MSAGRGPRRTAIALLATALSAHCPAAAPLATDGLALELAAGTARELAFDTDVAAAFIADTETADVNVLDTRKLFVLGKAPGVTSLRVHAADGTLIRAYAVRVHAPAEHAQTIVTRIAGASSGITVEPIGGALFVSGTAASAFAGGTCAAGHRRRLRGTCGRRARDRGTAPGEPRSAHL